MSLYLVRVRFSGNVITEYACGDAEALFKLARMLDLNDTVLCYGVFGAGCTWRRENFGWGPFRTEKWKVSGLLFDEAVVL